MLKKVWGLLKQGALAVAKAVMKVAAFLYSLATALKARLAAVHPLLPVIAAPGVAYAAYKGAQLFMAFWAILLALPFGLLGAQGLVNAVVFVTMLLVPFTVAGLFFFTLVEQK